MTSTELDFVCPDRGHLIVTLSRAVALTKWGVYAPDAQAVRFPLRCPVCSKKNHFADRMKRFYTLDKRVSALYNVAYVGKNGLLYSAVLAGTARAVQVDPTDEANVLVTFSVDPKCVEGATPVPENQPLPEAHLRLARLPSGAPIVRVLFAGGSSDHSNVGPVKGDALKMKPVLI